MIDKYASPEDLKRLVSALLVAVVAIVLTALFAFIVVPGLRSANYPPAARLPETPIGRSGWLDPLEFPPAQAYTLAAADPKTVMAATPRMLERGRVLFAENCAACHGEKGMGDGPAAKGLVPVPRDLTRPDRWKNGTSLTAVFQTLTEGVRGGSMSSFDTLPRKDRMALAHFVQSLGSFPKDKDEPADLKNLADSFASGGERIPARIPVSLAMRKLIEEASSERLKDAPADTPTGVGIVEKLGAHVPLDLDLLDEDGKKVTLRRMVNRPTVLVLVYYRCAGICTPLLVGLTRTLNMLPLEPGKDFNVVTVSFDPLDTPRIAKEKRLNSLRQIQRPFPPSAWRFLTGAQSSTRALADSVGFGFVKKDEDYIHPAALMILAKDGKLTRYMHGTTFVPADMQLALSEASSGIVRPTVSKFLAFCYTFDPESRRQVFRLNRVFGALTLAVAALFLAALLWTKKNPS
ncbi:MAG: c-type cytochrome [Elusimicrobiota bacterium]